jgi:hypothetical protein
MSTSVPDIYDMYKIAKLVNAGWTTYNGEDWCHPNAKKYKEKLVFIKSNNLTIGL